MTSRCKYCTHSTSLSDHHEIYKCDVTVEVKENVLSCANYDGYFIEDIYKVFNEIKKDEFKQK
jgi:hypothetical protein